MLDIVAPNQLRIAEDRLSSEQTDGFALLPRDVDGDFPRHDVEDSMSTASIRRCNSKESRITDLKAGRHVSKDLGH
jgi:hypothetical protein